MYCENCGKSLIRGYQFCLECGTPVPPQSDDEQTDGGVLPEGAENAEENTNETDNLTARAEPIDSAGGSLVFCTNCGMHMQTSTTVCEKCGMPLGSGSSGEQPAVPLVNNAMPSWNENPLGNDFDGMSEQDINQLNAFMNGGGVGGDSSGNGIGEFSYGGGVGSGAANAAPADDEIEALTAQLASFGASASDMPAIGMPAINSVEPAPISYRQTEPKPGEEREVTDFSMDGGDSDLSAYAGDVPVIEGGSMEENPDEDVSLDPYAFINNVLGDEPIKDTIADSATSAYGAVQPSETVQNVASAYAEAMPSIEGIASDNAYNVVPTAESVQPQFGSFGGSSAATETTPDIEPVTAEAVPQYDNAPETEPVKAQEEPLFAENTAPAESIVPEYEEPYIEEGAPFIEEGAPVIEEFREPEPAPAVQPSVTAAPKPEPIPVNRPAAKTAEQDSPDLGKLSYCRNCGQDMYEKEAVCKNCGAPYRAPVKHDRTLDSGAKKTNKVVPIAIAAAVVIIGAVALIATTNNGANKKDLTGREVLGVNVTTSSEPENEPVEVDNAAGEVTEENSDTQSAEAEAELVGSQESNTPEAPESAAKTTASHKTVAHTTPAPPTGSSTTASTSTAATPATGNASAASSSAAAKTSSAVTTTTKQTTPNTTAAASTTAMSSKVKSLENDRDAIMDAAAVIMGETGKISMFAENVALYMDSGNGTAENNRTVYYSRDFAKNMLSIIDSGKSAVSAAVEKADPTNPEMQTAYDALCALQKKYNAYYSFIKSPTGSTTAKFESAGNDCLSAVESALGSLKYSKVITSSYTDSDTNSAYAAALSDAVAAANNAVSALSTLEGKLTALDSSKFSSSAVSELSKSNVAKIYANAAAYSKEVEAYVKMLSGAPSAYTSAYNSLKSVSSGLSELVDIYSIIEDYSLSSYSSQSKSGISAVKANVSSVTKSIS
jgi:hypothetical protein